MPVRFLYAPRPVRLPDGLRRPAPRPPQLREPGYAGRFDATTFLYDVFRTADRYVLIGPPLVGLEPLVDWRLAMAMAGVRQGRIEFMDRCFRLLATIPAGAPPRTAMRFSFGTRGEAEVPLDAEARHDLLAGQRVLVTMSRDNEPAWIRDWIRFHVAVHGATAVLVYDNGSTRYSAAALLDDLASLDLAATVVVDWPFPYGPLGYSRTNSHWDSNFCQHGGLEHARHFFLGAARSFLNCDVDELVIPLAGEASVFAAAEASDAPVQMIGRWIEATDPTGTPPGPIAARRHAQYCYHRPGDAALLRDAGKYCVAPGRLADTMQCTTHHVMDTRVAGQRAFPALAASADFEYRHFRAISDNWRWRRDDISTLDLESLEEDRRLAALLDAVFGAA